MLGKIPGEEPAGSREAHRQLLGGQVEIVDIVVLEVKEVADFLVGGRPRQSLVAHQPVVEPGKLLAHLPVGLMQAHQGVGRNPGRSG